EVPPLRERTQARLAEVLPPGASPTNPVDCLPSRTAGLIDRVFAILEEEEADHLDYLVFVMGDSGLADNWEIYQALIRAMDRSPIPILPSLCTAVSSREAIERFRQAGKCCFVDEVDLARALGRVIHRPRLSEPAGDLPGYDRPRIAALLEGRRGLLAPETVREVLEAAGLRFPGQRELRSIDELAAVDLPFPWVMKVIGPSHKSDAGGVRLGISSLEEARAVWAELQTIPGACGCLVQETVAGPEVLLGANREEGFGHLVAFGLGGIHTEVFKDVRFALAPLSMEEAATLVGSIRALPILQGVRGQAGMDIPCLQDWLVRIGRLCADFPDIREMDLNPVKGQGKDLAVVDARILVEPA
ncbi:MAG TPA: acetate--CoA ligase family protein, partial [Holophaga sp.]|nr:acetate--CoA ligase family protein [Holophaga sp.]